MVMKKCPPGFIRTVFPSGSSVWDWAVVGGFFHPSFSVGWKDFDKSQRTLTRPLKVPEWIYSSVGVSEISTCPLFRSRKQKAVWGDVTTGYYVRKGWQSWGHDSHLDDNWKFHQKTELCADERLCEPYRLCPLSRCLAALLVKPGHLSRAGLSFGL